MKIGTITRQINNVLEDFNAEFSNMYTVADFERKLQKLKAVGNKSNRPAVLAELFAMFKACNIPFEKNRDNNYYAALIKNLDAANKPLDLPNKILKELYRRYQVYPAPAEYMARIVNRLENKNDGWQNNSLRLRILKQFIKYGDYLSAAGFKGNKFIQDYVKNKIGKKPAQNEILLQLDDEIFNALETADKAQKKPRGKFGLLKLADDLAGGKFRVGGATKFGLYLFAMVYNMTFSADKNPLTDIEKNLFHDYYNNNLIRFVSENYRGKKKEFEADPSGQGINYKNFAEIICLYFLAQDYSPAQKIKLSCEMINRLQNIQPSEKILNSDTKFYKAINAEIFNLSPKSFEKFVAENYNCSTVSENYSIGVMQVEAAQNTAFEKYLEILKLIEQSGADLKNCNYGLYFADVSALDESTLAEILAEKNCGEFLELLRALHKFLSGFNSEVSDAAEITRTNLITAYYYFYNAAHENDDYKNFVEFFKSFKSGADNFLEAAGYQLLSGKNFFDLAVVFSSYAYING